MKLLCVNFASSAVLPSNTGVQKTARNFPGALTLPVLQARMVIFNIDTLAGKVQWHAVGDARVVALGELHFVKVGRDASESVAMKQLQNNHSFRSKIIFDHLGHLLN